MSKEELQKLLQILVSKYEDQLETGIIDDRLVKKIRQTTEAILEYERE